MDALIESWQINNAANLRLLHSIPEEDLATLLPKGKSVALGFGHIHNVRLMWLKAASPDLLEVQRKWEPTEINRAILAARLRESEPAIIELLVRAGSPSGKIKGFAPHASAFVGYLIAHEAFHRGHIELALRQAGKPISDRDAYALWEWGTLAKELAFNDDEANLGSAERRD